MPQELPGFYYDPEKNRYFPVKGPIPGSSRTSSSTSKAQKPPTNPTQVTNFQRNIGTRASKLLGGRELDGNVIAFNNRRYNFVEEFQKIQASQSVVWKYEGTRKMVDSALDHMHVDVHTPEGQTKMDVLIAGNANGFLSLFEVGNVGQHFDTGIKCIPDRVWPVTGENQVECSKGGPRHIWRPIEASLQMSSSISCIKLSGKHLPGTVSDGLGIQRALITSLGSEMSGGSVCILDLVEPLDFYPRMSRPMLHEVASFSCTIWTADYNPNASRAVIGTNLGSALVNLETGMTSWVCRSKSDVLAQQFDQSANVVLCGLRNGAIVTVDVREKQEGSARLIRYRIHPRSTSGRAGRPFQNPSKWFEVKGDINPSSTSYMPSSICSLVSLQSYEQYFLASSMDGSIKLYDNRMAKRGAVQSYEGHVNSHSRLPLGVDPSERFLFAGGEDGNLRIWSLKSAELLFDENFSDSVLSTVCCHGDESIVRVPNDGKRDEDYHFGKNNSWGAWFGSHEGLFYLRCS